MTNQKLRKLKIVEVPHVIHTVFDAVRGVDFTLEGKVHVVIAFNPKNYFNLVQPLGKGIISAEKCSLGALVVDKK